MENISILAPEDSAKIAAALEKFIKCNLYDAIRNGIEAGMKNSIGMKGCDGYANTFGYSFLRAVKEGLSTKINEI